MAAKAFFHRRKRKRSKDIRSYVTVLPREEEGKISKKKTKSAPEDSESSYVSALTLSKGVRRKRDMKDVLDFVQDPHSNQPQERQSLEEINKSKEQSTPQITSNAKSEAPSDENKAPPAQSSSLLPLLEPPPTAAGQSSEATSSLACDQDDSPVILRESEILSEESLLALLYCDTQKLIEQSTLHD
uniref:Uncharacterized protein n=1 Tax=Amphimedon queenslandica TaxID=400682 RepID=A0A1X7VQY6_AMPQE